MLSYDGIFEEGIISKWTDVYHISMGSTLARRVLAQAKASHLLSGM